MDDQIPFVRRCTGGHDLRIYSGTVEFDRDKIGMTDVDTEANSGLVLAQFQPATYDIPHQISPAHDFGNLIFLVVIAVLIALSGFHPR
ncbi:hypothetical protein Xvie_04116 [Xenorhabdus vietnamensis]|uniref:Uncharacterized protein n=1 Tax=Xenorhabdus vietnamensis TaxID=351656 RepID=A0A1Y2S5N2_9GAMM|nr:hypothetical protein Xvie_04116 [Xenorhabdus vietnamensis]